MDIKIEKLNIINQILKIEDELLINTLKNLLEFGLKQESSTKNTEADFWDSLSDEQKKTIDLSIQQLKNGEGIAHEDVMAEFKQKYTK